MRNHVASPARSAPRGRPRRPASSPTRSRPDASWRPPWACSWPCRAGRRRRPGPSSGRPPTRRASTWSGPPRSSCARRRRAVQLRACHPGAGRIVVARRAAEAHDSALAVLRRVPAESARAVRGSGPAVAGEPPRRSAALSGVVAAVPCGLTPSNRRVALARPLMTGQPLGELVVHHAQGRRDGHVHVEVLVRA